LQLKRENSARVFTQPESKSARTWTRAEIGAVIPGQIYHKRRYSQSVNSASAPTPMTFIRAILNTQQQFHAEETRVQKRDRIGRDGVDERS